MWAWVACIVCSVSVGWGIVPPSRAGQIWTWVSCCATALAVKWLWENSNLACRSRIIEPSKERIVILGASTADGIGAAIARQCIARGSSRIVLVARRKSALEQVKLAIVSEQTDPEAQARAQCIRTIAADCTVEEDVHALQESLMHQLGGIDTLYLVFGRLWNSSLLRAAYSDPVFGQTEFTSLESLRHVKTSVQAMSDCNLHGTALVLAALIPCMQVTSNAPFVSTIGSLASLVPAPTRSVYCATKSAQQMLIESVALECETQAQMPGRALVQFSVLAPSTVSTSFRESSGAEVRASDLRSANQLRAQDVAARAVFDVDHRNTGVNPMPWKYFLVWVLRPLMYVRYLSMLTPCKALAL